MTRRNVLLLSTIAVLTLVGLAARLLIASQEDQAARRLRQEDLATRLGIRVDDYSYSDQFPFGYLYASLKPGMSIGQVHAVVRDFDAAWHCGGTVEVYSYYANSSNGGSLDARFVARYMMIYDAFGNYLRFEGEDKNSRTIHVDGCEVSALPESP